MSINKWTQPWKTSGHLSNQGACRQAFPFLAPPPPALSIFVLALIYMWPECGKALCTGTLATQAMGSWWVLIHHMTRSPPIGKCIWVGRYKNVLWSLLPTYMHNVQVKVKSKLKLKVKQADKSVVCRWTCWLCFTLISMFNDNWLCTWHLWNQFDSYFP